MTEGRELGLRISDRERELAVSVINQAVADGRLSWAEHTERLATVYAATTTAEVLPQLADLGGLASAPVPAQPVVAVFSKILRTPPSSRQIEVKAVFGVVQLNLSGLAAGEEITVVASSFCGKVVLIVGDGATVVDEGSVVLGKRALPAPPADRHGPVIRISGRSTMGKLSVLRTSSVRSWERFILGQ